VYEPVQRYVRRRVGPDSVDDIVSETMLTLWRRLGQVPAGAELPWVLGVARRHLANHRRASARHLRLVRRAESEPPPPAKSDHPLDAELHTALTRLSESEQELLRLWAWEGLEAADIASVLGLTANAASIRLHRAKSKLGKILEEERKSGTSSGHFHRESMKEERS
jgi:RNA polymerase sigma-70 factor (ECF subfamily)